MPNSGDALICVQRAQTALSSGNSDSAARHLLKGAEHYYLSALETTGRERNERLEATIGIARTALQLKQEREGTSKTRQSRKPVSEAEDGLTDFVPVMRPDVRFGDVVGLEDAKRAIDLALVRPVKHPELARRFGLRPGGGLLLFGPPGTGKTLLARAVAGEVDAPFYYVKPAEVMSQWVGQAERNIGRLFDQARRHDRAIIFIDEVESLVPSRAVNRSTVMARVVPQILAEMEGFEGRKSGLMFIGATNRPERIDEAMLRPGRLDHKIYIGPPDCPGRQDMFELHLKGRNPVPTVDCAALAQLTEGYTGADIANICEQAARRAFEAATSEGDETRGIEMGDFAREIESSRPSVSTSAVERYRSFAAGR